jgi:hypothetical protein
MVRRSNNETDTIASVLRVLPAKWVVAIIAIALVYFLLQPRLNAWFGWNLPTVAAMLGQEPPAKVTKKPDPKSTQSNSQTTKSTSTNSTSSGTTRSGQANPPPANNGTVSNGSASNGTANSDSRSSKPPESKTTPSAASKPTPSSASKTTGSTANNSANKASTADPPAADAKYRILKPVGRDRYESPAGLIYAPGSEEGHRLEHIAKHLRDEPDRPGSHGVFDGDMSAFLVAIDDAYKRAKGHAKGTKSRVEDGATILEAPFDQPIGYLGGTEGARRKYPKLKRMRIVLRDRNLITAFPIQ